MNLDFTIGPGRHLAKKISRRVAAELGGILSTRRRASDAAQLRVLTYHRFAGHRRDPVAVDPSVFEAQLQWLVEHVRVLSPGEFCAIQTGQSALTGSAVLLTIDDGHRSAFRYALPLLEKNGVKAIFFVCTDLVEAGAGNEPEFAGWTELREAQACGHEVAPHGASHRSLGAMPLEEAEAEIVSAQAKLHERLGVDGPFFSLPFGTYADFSLPLAEFLLSHGYHYCFTSVHGACSRRLLSSNLFPRLKVESGENLRMFTHIARGNLDSWRHVDALGWRLQQRGRM